MSSRSTLWSDPIHACFAPTASAMTAPRAPRLLRADRRVARGLIFDLGVEFDAEERRRGYDGFPIG